ncbi:sugar transferase [Hyphomicrobium sp.]|uniref:sugar transferase n=1 Tax=Hyphomicrobium sp. TaxID=82 RepID=UPI0025C32774|nr:sugar transferase [Hyphomicrobium sp.]MCC7250826.1 sugar transferase [Hyphomicrobium sp.]
MKRIFDLTFALISLPVVAPAVLACMAAVKLTSPGPAIFRQTRIGLREQPFTCYKLRTMYAETRNAPSHETPASSVTPVGRWLRRLKLDELPQLLNIIRGDMSFVGPRPCLPTQTDLIAARRQRGVYAIRPGITGVAQVAGIDMSDPERLAVSDAEYLGTMSLLTDLQLIILTTFGAGRGDRVSP